MNRELVHRLSEMLQEVTGFIYPNEIEIHWSILIVVYPYLTGLVAGAFILASLVKGFNVEAGRPTYRLSLLTALALLLVAPLPLLLHLGQPLRSYEIFLTPNLTSAMAMFGFVYAWYLMAVLLLELWFEYRRDLVVLAGKTDSRMRWIYRTLSLFSTDISEAALAFDRKAIRAITIVGIASAFLLHGYVGFIFGSVKANPWWSSVLMPIVFLFSAIVSGIALVILIYIITTLIRWKRPDMPCLNKLAEFLLYAMIIDFSLELLDFIHRLYESEESIHILSQLVSNRLFISLIVTQIILGSVIPMAGIILGRFSRLPSEMRRILYLVSAFLIQVGIFSIRWNVVIGGQLFSKSLRGLTVYKLELLGVEGLLMTSVLIVLPFLILVFLVKAFPPWIDKNTAVGPTA